ncbi:MAG: alpha/beta fold hydrolase [Acidobacteria bacterium]|nr:alpha/beta fold hydrolase [Acidobacteriota bacterium]
MPARRRTGRKLFKALLPVILLGALALAALVGWMIYGATHLPPHAYLVTPEQFSHLSDRGVKATDENWLNHDGTRARGWLLRGAEGAPAVLLAHRYGADRSWLLNLGVKLNETTNMTVLLPDLRGHGPNPPVGATSFGALEAEDLLAAAEFLAALRTPQGHPLVGDSYGLYGVEMGGYAALGAAQKNPLIRSLVLDSIPDASDDVLGTAVSARTGFDSSVLRLLGRVGARLYFHGNYRNTSACTIAESTKDVQVLLLSGPDAGSLRGTTEILAKCFPNPSNVEALTDLQLTGFNISSSAEQGEAYDRRVIEYFTRTLSKP